MAGGRPSKYDAKNHPRIAAALAAKNATDEEIAKALGIAISVFYLWKSNKKEFSESLKAAKELADHPVEHTLYQRAMGVLEVEEQIIDGVHDADGKLRPTKVRKIKRKLPPDTTAMIFWLKNRKPKEWRDRQEQAVTVESMPEIVVKWE